MTVIRYNDQDVETDGIRLPARIEKAIHQKHEHESSGHPPLWLIWLSVPGGDGVHLHAVANSLDAARYGCFIVLEQGEVWCERVPANHGFASSIQQSNNSKFWDGVRQYVKIHGYYKKEGD